MRGEHRPPFTEWTTTPGTPTTASLLGAGDLAGFVAVHVVAATALVVGVSWGAIAIAVATYTLRCWAVTAGFHRYFSHRSYRTSRGAQFVIALTGTTAMQKGALWWASTHRHHHRYADTVRDPHSPQHRSFLYSHCGWLFDPVNQRVDPKLIQDLTCYPELVWLERLKLLPVVAFGYGLWILGGPQAFVWGFGVSTVLLWHATLSTGSFSHRVGGYRNFATRDDSRNNRIIALLLMGEGWHNNHHRSPTSARQSTGRHEPDAIYASLRLLSWAGVVWGLRNNLPAPDNDVDESLVAY